MLAMRYLLQALRVWLQKYRGIHSFSLSAFLKYFNNFFAAGEEAVNEWKSESIAETAGTHRVNEETS
jgi:hypothetical protein